MGCVQQAVLEFDEEVRAPWRPRLVAVASVEPSSDEHEPEQPVLAHPSRRNPSRVGACRPPVGAVGRSAVGRRRAAAGERPGAPGVGAARPGRPLGIRRPRARLRLTRRARRLALVLALVAGVALGSWLAPLLGVGNGEGLRLAGASSVVVQPGDTLWSIASPVAAGGDVRVVVDEIRQINGLSSADLVPGQTLQLP
jgi:nucleoid-associated protein YgaU